MLDYYSSSECAYFVWECLCILPPDLLECNIPALSLSYYFPSFVVEFLQGIWKKNLVGIENWTFKRRLVQCRSISGPHPSPHIYTTQILIRSATSAAGFAYASHLCSLFDKSHNPSEFHLRLLAEIFLNEFGNLSYLDEEKSYWVIFSSIYLNCLLKVFLFFDP